MRTGLDVLNRSMRLLGYTDPSGNVDPGLSAELYKRGLDILNQVMAEIWPLEKSEDFAPLLSVHDEIPLSWSAVETVMTYGVCMFLAQADGDGTNEQFYAALYQQKRNAVKRLERRREDALPRVWED